MKYAGGNAGHNAPGLTKDSIVSIYIPSLFRGGSGTSPGFEEIDYYGLKTHRYELPESLLANVSKNPENRVYDLYKWDGVFVNLTSPTSLPAFITNKHNLYLQKEAFDLFKLYTNTSKKAEVVPIPIDRSYLDIEPNSGIALYI